MKYQESVEMVQDAIAVRAYVFGAMDPAVEERHRVSQASKFMAQDRWVEASVSMIRGWVEHHPCAETPTEFVLRTKWGDTNIEVVIA
jgi:hypothetical protein